MTAFETLANHSSNFWLTASRSFIIELIETKVFLLQGFESDENHVFACILEVNSFIEKR